MNLEESIFDLPKKHKQHKLSWEQGGKIAREKKLQEKAKEKCKQGREAKRNNI